MGALLIDLLVCGVPAAILAWLCYRRERLEARPSVADPAGFAEAFAAMFDSLIAVVLAGVAIMIGVLIALAVYGIYAVIAHATTGRTLGKRALKIRVVKTDGTACDWPAALKRAVIFPLGGSLLTSCSGSFSDLGLPLQILLSSVNGIWPLFNQNHQSLGDKLAGTRVVEELSISCSD